MPPEELGFGFFSAANNEQFWKDVSYDGVYTLEVPDPSSISVQLGQDQQIATAE
jgi:hypothetical protein